MAVSSYGEATSSSGVVRIVKDLETDIRGRHVILVEDIVDSGLTLRYLRRLLEDRQPASLEVAALLVREGDPTTSVTSGSRFRATSWSATASTWPSTTGSSTPSGCSNRRNEPGLGSVGGDGPRHALARGQSPTPDRRCARAGDRPGPDRRRGPGDPRGDR
ncbi:MAG: phosphoribosyltransferase family protein [Acidimicrobiales bacterium]